MVSKLHYNTVGPLLINVLKTQMVAREFDPFRLVGGTALGLLRGHRISADIDLFSDALYDSIDFGSISSFLNKTFSYVDTSEYKVTGLGQSYYIGNNKDDCVKLDLFYTEKFIQDFQIIDQIRLASVEDIIAMKMDVILRGGRKKDFWDIHELKDDYSIEQMLALHEKRYPYHHNKGLIIRRLTDFETVNEDFDPVCLKLKHWEIIKLDMIDFAKGTGTGK